MGRLHKHHKNFLLHKHSAKANLQPSEVDYCTIVELEVAENLLQTFQGVVRPLTAVQDDHEIQLKAQAIYQQSLKDEETISIKNVDGIYKVVHKYAPIVKELVKSAAPAEQILNKWVAVSEHSALVKS